MANTPREIVLEHSVTGEKGLAERLGYKIIRKLQWIGRRGAPDKFLARPFRRPCPHCGTRGRVLLIEFKRKGMKPDGQQEREIERLIAAGVEVYVIDEYEHAERVLDAGPSSL